jgi:predicted nuclease of restriction endonuclease-like (RecB) superfamily
MSLRPDDKYQNILTSLKEKIRSARNRASMSVNYELLCVYWEIGNVILAQQKEQGWGAKIIDKLAVDLNAEFPDFKGLSIRNLKYMRAFAEAYPDFVIVQGSPAQIKSNENKDITIVQGGLAQLSWYSHQALLDKVKTKEERLFYASKSIENGWSRNILVLQIENNLYQRQGNAITNFSKTLPTLDSDLANETLKSPYVFDFISFSEEIKERELEKALIQHLKKFMLELGRGFAYVGNQKNLVVDGDDFFLDLFFYNYILQCFVVFELKVGDFKPEYAGKLNFYVNTINKQFKDNHHNPTIGVLLCKTPNKTVIEFSLQGINSPIGVADYELSKSLPKELKGEIPSIAELEAEIEKEYEELKSPSQKKFDTLKEKLSKLKGDEIKQAYSVSVLNEIADKSLFHLYNALIERMAAFNEWFYTHKYSWRGNNTQYEDTAKDVTKFAEQWKNEEFAKGCRALYFYYSLNGFKKSGTEPFGTSFEFVYRMEEYWYGFSLVNYKSNQPILKKLYHEQLTSKDINTIVDSVYSFVMENIDSEIERLKSKIIPE